MIKKITISFFLLILCFVSYQSVSSGSGPVESMTNAPGTGEGNCTSCHGGSSLITSGSSGSNWEKISLTSSFHGNGYLPDSTYSIKISTTQSGVGRWGFQATVLDGSNKKAGILSAGSSGRVQKISSTALSRDYVEHTTSGTSATSSNTSEWVFLWKAPSKNMGPVKVYLCINGANGDGTSGGDQIYAKVFTINPSSFFPVANATSKDSVTCAGSTITLNGSSTQNPISWNWVFTGSGVSIVSPSTASDQNPQVKYNNPSGSIPSNTYWAILTSTNAFGDSKADSLKIIVRAKPGISISPASPSAFCKGDSVKLTATFNPTYKYKWSPGGATTQIIWAKDTGRYTVTVTDNNGCSNTSTPAVKVSHHPDQTISIARDVTNDTVCFERPVTITATGSSTFTNILYYNSAGLYQKTANNPQALKFSTSTDLFARGEDSKGCLTQASNKFNFVVKKGVDAPTGNCVIKFTSGFEIGWNAISNALGYKISLDSGKTWQTPSSGNNGLTHKVSGFQPQTDIEVWLKALDGFPCFESEITKIMCGSIPCSPLAYDVVWDKEVCKANPVNFKIRNLKTNFFSFKINGAGPFKDTVFTFTADSSRTYKFELTDSANLTCPLIKRDAGVKVWEIVGLQFTSSNPQNIFCEGSDANFSVSPVGMQEYNFFLNNVSKQKGSSNNWNHASPKNSDSVWVIVSNGACVSTSGKIKLKESPLPTAKFTHKKNGQAITFTPKDTGTAKFTWSFGDGNGDTVKTPTHTYAQGLQMVWIKLSVINKDGCSTTDSAFIDISASVNNTFKNLGIKIYPQPAKNSFKVEVPNELINAQISLSDLTGRIIAQSIADKKTTEIMVTDVPNGMYILTLNKDGNLLKGTISIQR